MKSPQDILDIYKRDETRGLRLLYETYYEILLLYAHSILADADAAEDVVQECFINLWSRASLHKIGNGLEKYLFAAVKYTAFNHARGRTRARNMHQAATRENLPESPPDPSSPETTTDNLAQLLAAVNRLPRRRREIFLMIAVDGATYRQVADRLRLSPSTVRTQMTRAVAVLRAQLKDKLSSILLAWIFRARRTYA